ncbi:MAG TPA: hypothetical protein VIY49_34335 [Bryobacteraceae bacterium]
MATEAILNLVWALLCVGALSGQFWRDQRRAGSRAVCWQRVVSILLAAVALFPVISASDDRLRLADIHAGAPPASAAFDHGQMHEPALSPPLEDPEHGQIAAPVLLFTFFVSFFALSFTKTPIHGRRFAGRSLGRAPPLSPARA